MLTVSLTVNFTVIGLVVSVAPFAGEVIEMTGFGSCAITNALSTSPSATNRRPPPALGVVKCSGPDSADWNLTAPVAGLRPYSVLSPSDTSQTIPPATIGGE